MSFKLPDLLRRLAVASPSRIRRPFHFLQTNKPTTMSDILYLLASIGFFALMLVFIRACDKV